MYPVAILPAAQDFDPSSLVLAQVHKVSGSGSRFLGLRTTTTLNNTMGVALGYGLHRHFFVGWETGFCSNGLFKPEWLDGVDVCEQVSKLSRQFGFRVCRQTASRSRNSCGRFCRVCNLEFLVQVFGVQGCRIKSVEALRGGAMGMHRSFRIS